MRFFYKILVVCLITLASHTTYAQDNVIEGLFTASFTGTSFGNSEVRNYTSSSFQLVEGNESFSNATLNFKFFTFDADAGVPYFGASNGFNLDFGNNNTFSSSGFSISKTGLNSFQSNFLETTSFFGTGVFTQAVIDTQFYGWQNETFMRWTDSIDTLQPAGPIEGTSTIRMKFTFTTPIPEPESYAMFIAGLGLIGFARKFKK